jgi:hypothetical protein
MPPNVGEGHLDDRLLDEMRSARRSPAVLKTRLASLRSVLPTLPIFAIEGIDDKPVYFQWVQRLRPGLDYEPFPCGGKRYVLQLLGLLARDLGGLRDGVYFFIDRDFDEWAGFTKTGTAFMTDRYSTESYLVGEGVLDHLLRDEFHCHAAPETRDRVIELFKELYSNFLSLTSQLNFRLYCAKRLGIEVVGGVPDKIGPFVDISFNQIKLATPRVEQLITLAREPTDAEICEVGPDFAELAPRLRYRGKYALQFFIKWMQVLGDERIAGSTPLFAGADSVTKIRSTDIPLGILASRSELPDGLQEFLASV